MIFIAGQTAFEEEDDLTLAHWGSPVRNIGATSEEVIAHYAAEHVPIDEESQEQKSIHIISTTLNNAANGCNAQLRHRSIEDNADDLWCDSEHDSLNGLVCIDNEEEEKLRALEFMRNFEAHFNKNNLLPSFWNACQINLAQMQLEITHHDEAYNQISGLTKPPQLTLEEWERDFCEKFQFDQRISVEVWEEHCWGKFEVKTCDLVEREEDRRMAERRDMWERLLVLDKESDPDNWPLEIQEWDKTSKVGVVAVGAITVGLALGLFYKKYLG